MDTSNNEHQTSTIPEVQEKPEMTEFWAQNPNVLLSNAGILEFFPIDSMSYNQKLNAISRVVIVLTVISFICTRNLRLLFIAIMTMIAIYFLHKFKSDEKIRLAKKSLADRQENFSGPAKDILRSHNRNISSNGVFQPPNSSNPFSNVLTTDYDYNPDKKPAEPAYNEEVGSDILVQAKKLVADANPGQPDITDKLFKNLGEQLNFEQSMRQFYSMPNTSIPNDQEAFTDFCYGNMVSCKEGNMFACAKNASVYTNH
jgi:hypothetical protein